jgi:hypothetical protein
MNSASSREPGSDPAAAFIREAGAFLREHDGESFEDPGYF